MRPQLSKLEVRISSVPSLSKSSTTTPPADENESTPSAGATSVNRPMLSADANADAGIRFAAATPPDTTRPPCGRG